MSSSLPFVARGFSAAPGPRRARARALMRIALSSASPRGSALTTRGRKGILRDGCDRGRVHRRIVSSEIDWYGGKNRARVSADSGGVVTSVVQHASERPHRPEAQDVAL